MSVRVVSWNDRMELTVETPGGETLVLDVPSLLHDAGLLSELTRAESVPLRVSKFTGKYVGVTTVSNGYSALSGRVASASARDTAYQRAVTVGTKRTHDDAPRPPTPPRPRRAPSPAYEPTSPAYEPTSPAYEPTSPAYDPAGTSGEDNREREEDDGEECEFVKERTRDERDEEGRANAIPLDE